MTVKDVVLRYRFEGLKEAGAESLPTGIIQGKPSVVMANASDPIIIAWRNLRDVLVQRPWA